MPHAEAHRSHRIGWLRATVLGANDGIVSTASLVIGVAAAGSGQAAILIAGVAGLVAGAMSMAAGEYVSVVSQEDTVKADLDIERRSLRENYAAEQDELAGIYRKRGLTPELARQVAEQLMEHDALGAHARDDIGISEIVEPRPIQAALSSAGAFTLGAAAPLAVAWCVTGDWQIPAIAGSSLLFLATLGAIAARIGGASMLKGAVRVVCWSTLAMAATFAIGHALGVSL